MSYNWNFQKIKHIMILHAVSVRRFHGVYSCLIILRELLVLCFRSCRLK